MSKASEPLVFYNFGRWAYGPDPSPFCIKLESFLRLANIPYTTVSGGPPAGSKSGRWPHVAVSPSFHLDDSQRIIAHLTQTHELTIDDHLSEADKILGEALRQIMENSLYHCIVRHRWVDNPQFIEAEYGIPAPKFMVSKIVWFVRRRIISALDAHGNGDMSSDEYHDVFLNDVRYIAQVLGSKKFILGDQMTTYDCSVYGMIQSLAASGLVSPASEFMKATPELMDYVGRINTLLFPNDLTKTGDTAQIAPQPTPTGVKATLILAAVAVPILAFLVLKYVHDLNGVAV